MTMTYSIDRIHDAADYCLKTIGDRKVIALHGKMGTGKTTLVHAICDLKKVKSPVSSPTFSIINEYNSPEGPICHIDLYRLENEEEVVRTGVEDCLYSGKICLVEWPEKAISIFPEDTVHIFIEQVDEKSRRLRIVNGL